ncbi:MAG: MgtC/SapB family protein [Phycisphaerales bacterium]|nr:MAG: MgtC/SapB family protein [Phycisphaerales bacterium]
MFTATMNSLAQAALPDTEYAIRLLAAVILGGFIGLEREFRDKPAGFRTIVLISIGACVFTIASQVIGGPDFNSTRIAAQIVTGIGFLGAGSILRERYNVVGLTTAATIWAVAAIGMATGFGMFSLAGWGTAAILVALLAFDVVEKWIGGWRDVQQYHIATPNTDDALKRIDELFGQAHLQTRKRAWHEDGPSLVFHIWAMGRKGRHEQLRMTLARSEEYELRRV